MGSNSLGVASRSTPSLSEEKAIVVLAKSVHIRLDHWMLLKHVRLFVL
jgi:hypothetical protein